MKNEDLDELENVLELKKEGTIFKIRLLNNKKRKLFRLNFINKLTNNLVSFVYNGKKLRMNGDFGYAVEITNDIHNTSEFLKKAKEMASNGNGVKGTIISKEITTLAKLI